MHTDYKILKLLK